MYLHRYEPMPNDYSQLKSSAKSPDGLGLALAELGTITVENVLLGDRLSVAIGKEVAKVEGLVDGKAELAADDGADGVVEATAADYLAEVAFEPGPETLVVKSPRSRYIFHRRISPLSNRYSRP